MVHAYMDTCKMHACMDRCIPAHAYMDRYIMHACMDRCIPAHDTCTMPVSTDAWLHTHLGQVVVSAAGHASGHTAGAACGGSGAHGREERDS